MASSIRRRCIRKKSNHQASWRSTRPYYGWANTAIALQRHALSDRQGYTGIEGPGRRTAGLHGAYQLKEPRVEILGDCVFRLCRRVRQYVTMDCLYMYGGKILPSRIKTISGWNMQTSTFSHFADFRKYSINWLYFGSNSFKKCCNLFEMSDYY